MAVHANKPSSKYQRSLGRPRPNTWKLRPSQPNYGFEWSLEQDLETLCRLTSLDDFHNKNFGNAHGYEYRQSY